MRNNGVGLLLNSSQAESSSSIQETLQKLKLHQSACYNPSTVKMSNRFVSIFSHAVSSSHCLFITRARINRIAEGQRVVLVIMSDARQGIGDVCGFRDRILVLVSKSSDS